MKIILAGHNVDYEAIKECRESLDREECLTPETISAAYARISRNPLPVYELRKIARAEVEKARRSNRNIVFGMGHSSIAEHAVFNVDIIGVSRLIVEEIEKFRLCSYTEKSQRYIRLEDDFVIPLEVRDAGLEDVFVETVRRQNSLYHELYAGLKEYMFEKHRDMLSDPRGRSTVDGWAKEDARYIVSMATHAQLGMTLNARNLELMLRRSAAHVLKEVNEYGTKLYDATGNIAPSLIRYTEATPFDLTARAELRKAAGRLMEKMGASGEGAIVAKDGNVVLVHATPDGDEKIIASIMHSSSDLPMDGCLTAVYKMDSEEKEEIIRTACRHMESYDPPLREFENAGFSFEVTVSASCFAQLKRHRMATMTCQEYNPSLGVTIPTSVREIGMEGRFMEVISGTDEIYGRIREVSPQAAPYILTNSHRKRVALKVNAREMYHISRLREDMHAQWDIRETAERMVKLGKKVMPLTLMLTAGKDAFGQIKGK
ncbi:MAG: FAD-dependent thymidylate synthase [Deltaproteobacteria bacterium]|nr:FAD-dependent thymidylate synthase [Deltaproteobacteria bacterium]MBW2596032.1 FAD-dependent thymidylate synthase [Deltaproteobacteria bacterium]MBW2650841.1 FAD-dependent thymidylate synthase [Deltaproteobacteria bacterium]